MYLCMNRIAQQLLQVRTLQAAYALMAASKQGNASSSFPACPANCLHFFFFFFFFFLLVSTLEDVHLTQCQVGSCLSNINYRCLERYICATGPRSDHRTRDTILHAPGEEK